MSEAMKKLARRAHDCHVSSKTAERCGKKISHISVVTEIFQMIELLALELDKEISNGHH